MDGDELDLFTPDEKTGKLVPRPRLPKPRHMERAEYDAVALAARRPSEVIHRREVQTPEPEPMREAWERWQAAHADATQPLPGSEAEREALARIDRAREEDLARERRRSGHRGRIVMERYAHGQRVLFVCPNGPGSGLIQVVL
jgi:hypothetical protein